MTAARGTGRVGRCLTLCVGLALAQGCEGTTASRPAEGWLQSTTPRLDFGATVLGLGVPRDLGVMQRGVLSVEVVATRLLPDEGVFLLGPTPRRVAPDGSATLTLTYRPLVAGRHQAVLELELRDGAPLHVALEGRGVDARAEPQPPVDFGRPAVGAVRRRTLVLRNASAVAVPATLAFVGPDAEEFAASAELWLQPFSQLEAHLRYAPEGRPGPRAVALRLGACPVCAPQDLSVAADAVPSALVFSPDPVAFGGTPIDSARHLPLSITNATDEVISLTSVALGPATEEGYALEPVPPHLLAPLDTVRAALAFTPTRLGVALGTVEVASDAEPTPRFTVSLSAAGGGAQLVVTPDRLNFKAVPVFGRGVLAVTVANGGADPASPPLHLLGLAAEGEGFSVVQAPTPAPVLAAGQQVEARLAFSPTRVGPQAGRLRVFSDDPLAPEMDVLLVGHGTENTDCRLKVQPPALDFGGVRATRGAVLGSRITNVGTEPCSLWGEAVEGDPAFTVARARPFVRLDPGVGVFAPVAFRPPALGRATGRLVFQTSLVGTPRLEIPLTGGSDDACLRPEPPYLAFGPRRVDCGPALLAASFHNVCTHPVDVTSLVLGPGADPAAFSLVSPPPVPATLAADGRLPATVRFTPASPGTTASPLFAQASDVPLPLLLPVSGETVRAAEHDEQFLQVVQAKVDLLWVVDNTASMDGERAALVRGVGRFVAEADRRGLDYRIGVTTTGVGPPPPGTATGACPGGAGGAESGRLFPVDHARPRVVDPSQRDRAELLARNVDVGGCHSIEQGFEAARLALSPPLVDNADDARTPEPLDGNLGLLRDDASLAIVVVSDEDDASPTLAPDAVRQLRALKPLTPVTFSAIVAPAAGCASAVAPGRKYLEVAQALDGVTGSVCDDDLGPVVSSLADLLYAPRSRFVLAAAADPATLEVTVDGQPATAWRYDASPHAVVFDQPPAAGARLRVTYDEPCPPP